MSYGLVVLGCTLLLLGVVGCVVFIRDLLRVSELVHQAENERREEQIEIPPCRARH